MKVVMFENFDKYLKIANRDIQMANNHEELKSYVASILYDNEKKAELLQQKEKIIKEVREYVEKNKVMTQGHFDGKQWIYQHYELICDPVELLEILDKEVK